MSLDSSRERERERERGSWLVKVKGKSRRVEGNEKLSGELTVAKNGLSLFIFLYLFRTAFYFSDLDSFTTFVGLNHTNDNNIT